MNLKGRGAAASAALACQWIEIVYTSALAVFDISDMQQQKYHTYVYIIKQQLEHAIMIPAAMHTCIAELEVRTCVCMSSMQ